MNQIAKFLPLAGQPQPSSDSTSPEATLPAPLSENSAVARAEGRLVPASAKEMALCLNELLSVYGVPAGWDTGASVYRRLWANLPGDMLRDAIDRYMASDTEWFPKPGQILALAAEEMAWRRKRLDNARDEARAMLSVPVEQRITAEEVEAVMAKYRSRFRATPAPPALGEQYATPSYVVDEVPETIAGKPWRAAD